MPTWSMPLDDEHLSAMPFVVLAVIALICGVAWIIMNRDIDKK